MATSKNSSTSKVSTPKVSTPKDTISMLSFTSVLRPSNFAMYSTSGYNRDAKHHRVVEVYEQPLRGLNATGKTPEEKKNQAVLQVVESARLYVEDDTLVMKGSVRFSSLFNALHSCNNVDFIAKHDNVLDDAIKAGDVKELANRYAFQMASGSWGWRNAMSTDAVTVIITYKKTVLEFKDLIFDASKGFDFKNYPEHQKNLIALSEMIETTLSTKRVRATIFNIEGYFNVGLNAYVYPSQEWPSEHAKKDSQQKWQGGEGVTRVLAKVTQKGVNHAIINDRKVGNALRTIDTWYTSGEKVPPIAVEPYGASSHTDTVLRSPSSLNIFGMVQHTLAGNTLSQQQRLYYVASVIRGGVYGASE